MEGTRIVVVVNPQAQSGALGRKWPYLAGTLRRELGSFEEAHTKAPGDATRITREALRGGATCVAAMGGDGTIGEVINGFFEDGERIAPDACLGLLPFGTGGDFRKTVDVPNDIAVAARIVSGGKSRSIDIGRIDYHTRQGAPESRYFVNIASFGISGLVDRLVNESPKRFGGRVAFFAGTVRASLRYTNQRVRLRFDGSTRPEDEVEMTINTVAIANGRYFGGGMFIAPEAEVDDSQFDVVALGDFGFKDIFLHGRRIYGGTHLGLEKVSHRRATTVYAEPCTPGEEVELDIDGEAPGILPATFTIVPGAIKVLVPAL